MTAPRRPSPFAAGFLAVIVLATIGLATGFPASATSSPPGQAGVERGDGAAGGRAGPGATGAVDRRSATRLAPGHRRLAPPGYDRLDPGRRLGHPVRVPEGQRGERLPRPHLCDERAERRRTASCSAPTTSPVRSASVRSGAGGRPLRRHRPARPRGPVPRARPGVVRRPVAGRADRSTIAWLDRVTSERDPADRVHQPERVEADRRQHGGRGRRVRDAVGRPLETPTPTVPANDWQGHGWTFWQYRTARASRIVGRVDGDWFDGLDLTRSRSVARYRRACRLAGYPPGLSAR